MRNNNKGRAENNSLSFSGGNALPRHCILYAGCSHSLTHTYKYSDFSQADKVKCEEVVIAGPTGCFLIREASRLDAHGMVLYVLCVNDEGINRTYVFMRTKNNNPSHITAFPFTPLHPTSRPSSPTHTIATYFVPPRSTLCAAPIARVQP